MNKFDLCLFDEYATKLGLDYRVEELLSPPPEFAESSPSSGITIAILEPFLAAEAVGAKLTIWLPHAGLCGLFNMRRGDSTKTGQIKSTAPEKVIPQIERLRQVFYRDFIYSPTIRKWLDEQGIPFTEASYDFRDQAAEWDCGDWFIVEFQAGGTDHCPMIIGVSGRGDVAEFVSDEGGWLDFEWVVSGLKSAEDLVRERPVL